MQPGTGTLTVVKPYPGSQKINTQTGKDNDGGYTMTQYTTSADVATVSKSFESQFKNGGSYTSSSIGAKTYLKATTAFGLAKVDIIRQDGKTHYYIKIFKIKAGQMMPPFPEGFPAFPKGFPQMPKQVAPSQPHPIHPKTVM
jgi:hypothetical protein